MAANNKKIEKAKNRVIESVQASDISDETKKNISKIIDIESAQRENRTIGERIAETVAQFCGSMTFVWVHIAWFGLWIILNTIPDIRFDPFPYTFLTLVGSLEAIFLSTFILISQNHDTKLSEKRNHLDLQINLLSEQENTKMLQLLHQIAAKVGVKSDDDPDISVLEEATRPDKLGEQIEETIKATEGTPAQRK